MQFLFFVVRNNQQDQTVVLFGVNSALPSFICALLGIECRVFVRMNYDYVNEYSVFQKLILDMRMFIISSLNVTVGFQTEYDKSTFNKF